MIAATNYDRITSIVECCIDFNRSNPLVAMARAVSSLPLPVAVLHPLEFTDLVAFQQSCCKLIRGKNTKTNGHLLSQIVALLLSVDVKTLLNRFRQT